MVAPEQRHVHEPSGGALLLAEGLFRSVFAKTSHGLVRGPSRWPILGVVDSSCAGADAGELLDGRRRGIPIFASLEQARAELAAAGSAPASHAVIGVATVGGVLPAAIRHCLEEALRAGMTVVNGLHHLLGEREPALVALAERFGGAIIDIRRPPPAHRLHFWSGRVLELDVPRVAVLGTDCALGKRTTAGLVRQALERRGLVAELIFTGQTGWLQGYAYGFILDATPNDFVCGELEQAIVRCARESKPDVILIEGQSALRNPSGPCGAELLLAGAVSGVILQHAPDRVYFEGLEEAGYAIPTLESEVALIAHYGVPVLGVGLHAPLGADDEGREALEHRRARLEESLGLPVTLPLEDAGERLATQVMRALDMPPADAARDLAR